jgi:hypothetical protein
VTRLKYPTRLLRLQSLRSASSPLHHNVVRGQQIVAGIQSIPAVIVPADLGRDQGNAVADAEDPELEPGTNVEAVNTESQIDGRKGTVLWHEQDGSYIVLMDHGRCYRLREGQCVGVPRCSDTLETASSDAGAD